MLINVEWNTEIHSSTWKLMKVVYFTTVIMPSVNIIENFKNIIAIDATFHKSNNNVTASLTTLDSKNKLVLFGFTIGVVENKDIMIRLLSSFKNFNIVIRWG